MTQARRERAEALVERLASDARCFCSRDVGVHFHWPGTEVITDALLAFAAQEAEQASAQAHTLAKHDIAEVVAQARIAEEASIKQARAEERERLTEIYLRKCSPPRRAATGMMRRTPMRRTGRLRSRRQGHQGTVAGRSSVSAPAWRALVALLKERHGNRCCVPWCRVRKPLDAHHVTKRSQGGADSIGNPMAGDPGVLVPLCRKCHEATDYPFGPAPFGTERLTFAPVSSDPPLACGFYVRQGDRSGFIALLASGGATHETF